MNTAFHSKNVLVFTRKVLENLDETELDVSLDLEMMSLAINVQVNKIETVKILTNTLMARQKGTSIIKYWIL